MFDAVVLHSFCDPNLCLTSFDKVCALESEADLNLASS